MNAKDRIQQYIDYKGISNSKFEIEVGLSNGYWRKTKSISSSVVEKILRIYSELNPLWVLTGEGEMLRPATISTRDNLNISGGNVIYVKEMLIITSLYHCRKKVLKKLLTLTEQSQ